MTTTTVSDAVILPQSQGTGLSGENATIDAAINGVLNRYVGGEYVATEYSTGLAFQNHDAANDTVEVGPGIVFIQDNSTSTGGQRSGGGNPQAESSTTSGYDTELPEGHTYAVLFPTATQISVSDSTLNEVYVDIPDVTANNGVTLEHDGVSAASPSTTSLKIGETNPDDASADTRANDDASPTFDSLTVNNATTTDALNANALTIGGDLFIEADNSPINVSGTSQVDFNFNTNTDHAVVIPQTNANIDFDQIRIDGESGSDYNFTDISATRTTGATEFDLGYQLRRFANLEIYLDDITARIATNGGDGTDATVHGSLTVGRNAISTINFLNSSGDGSLKARIFRRGMNI